MKKLYSYRGLISSFGSNGSNLSIVLYDIYDNSKAPTRLEVVGGLAKYISEIEGTDAEERYLNADYFYNNCLYLHRIEIPSSNENIPAKIITQADLFSDELVIFGPKEYIETRDPQPMSREQACAWFEFRAKTTR